MRGDEIMRKTGVAVDVRGWGRWGWWWLYVVGVRADTWKWCRRVVRVQRQS